jgi:hypothetical protein
MIFSCELLLISGYNLLSLKDFDIFIINTNENQGNHRATGEY